MCNVREVRGWSSNEDLVEEFARRTHKASTATDCEFTHVKSDVRAAERAGDLAQEVADGR